MKLSNFTFLTLAPIAKERKKHVQQAGFFSYVKFDGQHHRLDTIVLAASTVTWSPGVETAKYLLEKSWFR